MCPEHIRTSYSNIHPYFTFRSHAVHDNIIYHLLCDQPNRVYVKPIPRYLLCSSFWREHLKCPVDCTCTKEPRSNCDGMRGVAFGFL
ncbi:hypothetical protein F5B19DRAFT_468751 [Rostrohypoxylon terebratum]|nr:hypothetical protein F5B19DRAFT_468751 [Rostrohypoxylon terebratum]